MKGFDRFENRHFFQGVLRMDTALHVGAQLSLDPVGTDMPVLKSPEGQPYVPGSSLKGVVRSQVEQLIRALEAGGHFVRVDGREETLRACDPFASPCLSADRVKEVEEQVRSAPPGNKEELFSAELWGRTCTVCRLFGSPHMAARLRFEDATLFNSHALLRLSEIRDGVGIDRDLGSARPGIKFDYEVVPAGASFRFSVIGENLDDWEAGLFLTVLQPWTRGEAAIGGKTSRGLGWTRLDDLSVKRVESKALLDYLLHRTTEDCRVEELVVAFTQHLKRREG